MDFLRRCKHYDMWPFELPQLTKESQLSPEKASQNEFSSCAQAHCSLDLVSMAAGDKPRLNAIETGISLNSDFQEEVMRDFYLLSFKRWTAVCLEKMESIALELEMLRMMDSACESYSRPLAQTARPLVETFTLTRDAVQAQVFGTSYRSLPTVTVGDWYEQRSQEGRSHDLGLMMKPPVEMGSDLRLQQQEVIKIDDE